MQQVINNYLKRWGTTPDGKPIMRLVWSDYQRELRTGEFNEFYGSIFIRTVIGTKEVPKYPWIHERWVLERWFPPSVVLSAELPESRQGSYEPIYIFQDALGNALELNLRVVELICSAMLNQPPTRQEIQRGLAQHLEEKDKRETVALEEEVGASMSSPVGSSLSLGEGVAYGKHKGGQ